jgi:hypothetical protein
MSLSKAKLNQILESTGGQHLTAYLKNDGTAHEQLKEHLADAERVLRENHAEDYATQFVGNVESLYLEMRDSFAAMTTLGLFVKDGSATMHGFPTESDSFYVLANSFHVKPLMSWLQNLAEGTLIFCEPHKIKLVYTSQTDIRTVFELPFNGNLFGKETTPSHNENISVKPVGLYMWLKLMFENKNQTLPNPVLIYGDEEVVDITVAAVEKLKSRQIAFVRREKDVNLGEALFWSLQVLKKETSKSHLRIKSRYSRQTENELVSDDWNEILQALKENRLLSLMVANDVRVFGKIDALNNRFRLSLIQKDHEDDDVLDDISQMAMQKGVPTLFFDSSKLPSTKRKLLKGLIEPKQTLNPHSEHDGKSA